MCADKRRLNILGLLKINQKYTFSDKSLSDITVEVE